MTIWFNVSIVVLGLLGGCFRDDRHESMHIDETKVRKYNLDPLEMMEGCFTREDMITPLGGRMCMPIVGVRVEPGCENDLWRINLGEECGRVELSATELYQRVPIERLTPWEVTGLLKSEVIVRMGRSSDSTLSASVIDRDLMRIKIAAVFDESASESCYNHVRSAIAQSIIGLRIRFGTKRECRLGLSAEFGADVVRVAFLERDYIQHVFRHVREGSGSEEGTVLTVLFEPHLNIDHGQASVCEKREVWHVLGEDREVCIERDKQGKFVMRSSWGDGVQNYVLNAVYAKAERFARAREIAESFVLGCSSSNVYMIPDPSVFSKLNCDTCHKNYESTDLAPALAMEWGTSREMSDGSFVVVDDTYVARSIFHHDEEIVKGYLPSHMDYTVSAAARHMDALVGAVRSLTPRGAYAYEDPRCAAWIGASH